MDINIAPRSGMVIIDGENIVLNLSSMHQSIQGLHWSGESGEIARWNPDTRQMLGNEEITDLTPYQWIVDAFYVEKAKKEAEYLAQQEAMKIPMAFSKRNSLLTQSDWTQLPDVPLTLEKKQEWEVYRQALRDLPSDPLFPNVEFPTPPQ